MSDDQLNANAAATLMADAERALALIAFEDVRGNPEWARQTIAQAHHSYDDLIRRGERLILSSEQRIAFQGVIDRLRASLRFFGETV